MQNFKYYFIIVFVFIKLVIYVKIYEYEVVYFLIFSGNYRIYIYGV